MTNPQEITQNPPSHLPIGTQLQEGKYTILQVLGQGGFGITYLAEHIIFGKVALKELFLNSGTVHCSRENTTGKQVIAHFEPQQFAKFKSRFLEEAKTLYQLREVKGVVHVRDVFEENGTAYFSMDYLQGTKLSDYVKNNKPLLEAEGLRIAKSLSTIVAAVHQHNILHRDIKPDNVIIAPSGEVYLIDFGIAKQYLTEIDQTHTTFHSPRYSPPEQKASKSKMGTYSDVFSLGATAYLVFTGIPPQSLEDRLLHDFIPPNQQNLSLSSAINDTICRSMELKTENRIQKAEAFLTALDGITPNANPARQLVEKTPVPQTFDVPDTSDKTLVVPRLDNESTKIDHVSGNDVTKVDLVSEVNTGAKEVTNIEATVIDVPPEKPKRAIDWEAIKAIPQNIPSLFRSQRRSVLAILFLLLAIIAASVFLPRKKEPVVVEPPVEQKMINFSVTDTNGQQLQGTRVIIGSLDTTINLNSLSLNIAPHWEALKDEMLTIEHDGYFPEALKISTLVNDTTQVKLTPIALSDIDTVIENLMEFDWFNKRKEKLVFDADAEDTLPINFNPSGSATLNGQDAFWFFERTKDSTFLVLTDPDTRDNEIARFILPVSFYGPTATDLTRIDGAQKQTYTRKKKVGSEPKPKRKKRETPTIVRELNGKVVDQDNKPLAGIQLKITNTDIVMTTNSRGEFSRDLTTGWDKIKDEDYTINLSSYFPQRKSVKVDESRPNLIITLIKRPVRVILDCPLIKSYWIAGNDLFLIKNCSTDVGGEAEYKGIPGRWLQTNENGQIYISFDSYDRSRAAKLLVQNPTSERSISLLNENEQRQKFSKISAEDIFCKKITGNWKYDKDNKVLGIGSTREISLSIEDCSLSNGNIRVRIKHDGKDGTAFSAKIDVSKKQVDLGFAAGGENYIIQVDDPLILNGQGLTIKKQLTERTVYKLIKSN